MGKVIRLESLQKMLEELIPEIKKGAVGVCVICGDVKFEPRCYCDRDD